MEYLSINGGKPLNGSVEVAGAKNAALPACVATLLTDEPVLLRRVPRLRDCRTILATVASLGKKVKRSDETVEIDHGEALTGEPEARYVAQMRASFLVLGPLLARLGEATVPLPGGCTIGPRPIDLHLEGLRQLGADIETRPDSVSARARRLKGTKVRLSYPSVGATEQLVMTATLARGETVIENPAREPEIDDLVCLLKKMGAEIEFAEGKIAVQGSDILHGAEHTVIPDRLEAGTYLLAGAITMGEVEVRDLVPSHLQSLLEVLDQAKIDLSAGDNSIALRGGKRGQGVNVSTAPYPGFPTDLQPPLVAFLCLADGNSRVCENVFEHRFGYIESLKKMGALVKTEDCTAYIEGASTLNGTDVKATDIRAGAALVLAGLAAEGHTRVAGLESIDRGYASIERKLRSLGAKIERREK